MRAPTLSCWLLTAACALALTACSGDDEQGGADAPVADAAVDAPTDAANTNPTMLSETGLYSDLAAGTLAPGVVEYAPRWQLWSDRAVKRRWIYLPPGTKIDTTDMDFWSFPQGTKLWKEFTRDGVRIETRLLWKQGPTDDVGDWFMVSFQWNQAQTDAMAVTAGVVDDAGNNDIPSRSDCRKCHGPDRIPSVVLGFGALQLDYDDTDPARMDLGRLVAEQHLTTNPTGSGNAYFPLPSTGLTDPTPAAFGYLHANCGGCHNSRSSLVSGQTVMQLRLETATTSLTSWSATPTWKTTVGPNGTGVTGQLGGTIVRPGMPDQSTLFQRLSTTGTTKMPPVGRETTDDQGGIPAVRAWISALP